MDNSLQLELDPEDLFLAWNPFWKFWVCSSEMFAEKDSEHFSSHDASLGREYKDKNVNR